MEKVRIAIIGATGSTFKRTIPALVKSQICRVVSIQGRNFDKLNEIKSKYQIEKIFTDVEEMLTESNFDCIYIGTPPFLHYKNIELASQTLKPIICEKPLCRTYKEGIEIKHLLRNYSVDNFMIAHHLRHQQAISDLKKILEEKEIGDIVNASIQWGFEMNLDAANAKWKKDPLLGGEGTFNDNGIHIVDLAIHLFGLPNFVFGQVNKHRTKETFDNETGLLLYDKFNVYLNSSQSMQFSGNHILIYGTQGAIEIFNGIGEKSIRKISIKSTMRNEEIEYPEINLYGNEVENFCKKILEPNYENKGTSLSEGIEALKIIELIRVSSRTNTSQKY